MGVHKYSRELVLLLEDKSWRPGVAVGLEDIGGGATFFRSGYVMLSKSLFGRVRGTFGFGTGPDVLKGPFAGVELALNRFVTLLGEYDVDAFNAGVCVSFAGKMGILRYLASNGGCDLAGGWACLLGY